MTDDEHLQYVRRLGAKFEEFLRTNHGKYLVQCCDREIEKGVTLLRKADPDKPETVRHAQNTCRVGELVKQWLQEVVVAGHQAEQTLEQRD